MSIKLPKLFCDGMILQRDVSVRIWGEADYPVTVSIDMHSATDFLHDGKFELTLPPHKEGGPYTMFIECAGEVTKLLDVYFGDVFLAGGQSNMAMTLEDIYQPLDKCDSVVRMFTPDREREYPRRPETDDRWVDICEANKRGISATASHFAVALSNAQKVPVGIISCNQSASVIRSWISPETTDNDPIFGEDTKWHPDADDDEFPFNKTNHQYLERLQYLAPYNVKGVIWYQGESDSYGLIAPSYLHLFELLVKDWRRAWRDEELPFIAVQLASFKAEENESWEIVRECQLKATETIPNVGMITNGDIGDLEDIHPRDKKTVGERLALYARGMIYGEDILHRPPVCREAYSEDGNIVLRFSDTGEGLYEKEKLTFYVTGENGEKIEDEYELCGDTIRIKTGVVSPDEVRFCFDDVSFVHLYSSADLPASPFRIKIQKITEKS